MRSPSILSRPEIGAAALLVLLAASAVAAPAESEAVRQSREHYRKGDEAYAAGRYDDAYREFDKGYQLAPRPVFLLNLGHTERRRGNLVSARAFYQKFLLIEPQSRYAPEVQQVIQEIDSALAAENASQFPAPGASEPVPPLPGPDPRPDPITAVPPAAVIEQPLPVVRPLYKRWWVWATAGAVVAAGLTTALLLGRSSYQQEGSLGTLGR
jgi:tetratricopeptide (TPR) repeat protein